MKKRLLLISGLVTLFAVSAFASNNPGTGRRVQPQTGSMGQKPATQYKGSGSRFGTPSQQNQLRATGRFKFFRIELDDDAKAFKGQMKETVVRLDSSFGDIAILDITKMRWINLDMPEDTPLSTSNEFRQYVEAISNAKWEAVH